MTADRYGYLRTPEHLAYLASLHLRVSPEGRARMAEAKRVHGQSHHPLYTTWRNMMTRCYNPRVREYQWYGARGVTVCERWRDSPGSFIADVLRVIGPRPGRASYFSLIDRDWLYEPLNVCWSPRKGERQENPGPA